MACKQETQILISRYANEESSHEEIAGASAHLDGCAECRDLFEQWREQRQLFVWANTLSLPDLTTEVLLGKCAEVHHTAVAARTPSRRFWSTQSRAWLGRSAFASVCLVAAFGFWHSSVQKRMPRLASGATLFRVAQTVRVYDGATLEVAPNTRLTRLSDNRVRLDSGWIRARVRHGGGLRISTSRLDVRDFGTVFQMSAGPVLDNVFVEEGTVSATGGGKSYTVDAGQILLASGNGKFEVARFPKYDPVEDEPGQPLVDDTKAFLPQTDDDLDWKADLRRLQSRFPEARRSEYGGGGVWYCEGGTGSIRSYVAIAAGVRKNLRSHVAEIAEAQAGATTNIGDWSFPVAYVIVESVVEPAGLPADAYRVDMAANGAGLFWKFTGCRGTELLTPLRFEMGDGQPTNFNDNTISCAGNVYACSRADAGGAETEVRQLADWPGAYKPTLSLELRTTPNQGSRSAMLDEAIRSTAGVPDLALRENDATVLNLNAHRSVRVLIAHNRNAGRQLGSLLRDGKPYRAGSALMGVVMTESAWAQPPLPAGGYLLWWTVERAGSTPRWAVSRPGTSRLVYLTPETVTISDAVDIGGSEWPIWSVPGTEGRVHPDMNVRMKTTSMDSAGFPFEFEASAISSSGSSYSAGAGLGKGRFVLRAQ